MTSEKKVRWVGVHRTQLQSIPNRTPGTVCPRGATPSPPKSLPSPSFTLSLESSVSQTPSDPPPSSQSPPVVQNCFGLVHCRRKSVSDCYSARRWPVRSLWKTFRCRLFGIRGFGVFTSHGSIWVYGWGPFSLLRLCLRSLHSVRSLRRNWSGFSLSSHLKILILTFISPLVNLTFSIFIKSNCLDNKDDRSHHPRGPSASQYLLSFFNVNETFRHTEHSLQHWDDIK